MARLIAASPALIALAACMHHAPLVDGPVMAMESLAPLEARVWASDFAGSPITIDLTRPAHVAVFEVVPGSGTVLLYPRPGQPSLLHSGRSYPHVLSGTRFFNASGSAYDWVTGSSSWRSTHAWAQPRHIFLVASESPLETEALNVWSSWGGGVLTHYEFASFSANTTMSRLLDVILPRQSDGQWATDVYTIWPQPPASRTRRYANRTSVPVTLNCDGNFVFHPAGSLVDVIRAQLRSGCTFVEAAPPRDTTKPPKPQTTPPGKPTAVPPSTTTPPASPKGPIALPVRPRLPGATSSAIGGDNPAHEARVRTTLRADEASPRSTGKPPADRARTEPQRTRSEAQRVARPAPKREVERSSPAKQPPPARRAEPRRETKPKPQPPPPRVERRETKPPPRVQPQREARTLPARPQREKPPA